MKLQDGVIRRAVIRKLLPVRALILLAIMALPGCEGFFTDPLPTSISVIPSTPSLVIGGTLQMVATAVFDDGSTGPLRGTITWTSSDTSVATIDSNGLVTGVAAGTTTITATSQGVSGSTTATVRTASLQSIAVSPTAATITSGQTQAFTAEATLSDSSRIDVTTSVTWRSSDTTVATIASTGIATAKTVTATATTNITATSGTVTSNTAVLTVNP